MTRPAYQNDDDYRKRWRYQKFATEDDGDWEEQRSQYPARDKQRNFRLSRQEDAGATGQE